MTISSQVFSLFVCGVGLAQVPMPDRVVHLWVDPVYGDDTCASMLNPSPSYLDCAGNASYTSPLSVTDPAMGGAYLLHASAPFKTVTAAIGYIKAITNGGLPHTVSGVIWKYAIIHCLPGLYGPASSVANTDIGLFANGETFPIHLPPGVSVQGTSALNTVFNLFSDQTNLGTGPAFEFGVHDSGGTAINGVGSFIDRVSIHEATEPRSTDRSTYAAIYIGPEVSSRPTISNCFLFHNNIGIAIAASYAGNPDPNPTVAHHGTTIVNNTFAFNYVGLWNGQDAHCSGGCQQGSVGASRLIVLNNIFDSGTPTWIDRGQQPSGDECPRPYTWNASSVGFGPNDFIGVPAQDMTVASINCSGPECVQWQGDFNAYEYNDTGFVKELYNGNFFNAAADYAPTALRPGGNMPLPAPSRNIARFTGNFSQNPGAQNRGVLFIRDLFCNMHRKSTGNNPSARFDSSAMDFRLSPAAAPSYEGNTQNDVSTPGGNGEVNPLINNGLALSDLSKYPIVMQNGEQLFVPPGYLPLESGSQHTWAFHSWTFDGEGFGNPRIHAHPLKVGAAPYGFVDIGADEVGDLIAAGYQYGTTTFGSYQATGGVYPDPSVRPDNKYLYLVGVPATLAGSHSPNPELPWFRMTSSKLFPELIANKPYPWIIFGGFPYGQSFWDTENFSFDANKNAQGMPCVCCRYYKPAISRINPHLLPDLHPWWFTLQTSFMTASYWLWEPCLPWHNMFLFVDPTTGTINPPGTYMGGSYMRSGLPTLEFEWMDTNLGVPDSLFILQWRAWGGGPSRMDGFDEWCRAFETANPNRFDALPKTFPSQANPLPVPIPRSLRFSLENADGGVWSSVSNVQSFQVVVEGADDQ